MNHKIQQKIKIIAILLLFLAFIQASFFVFISSKYAAIHVRYYISIMIVLLCFLLLLVFLFISWELYDKQKMKKPYFILSILCVLLLTYPNYYVLRSNRGFSKIINTDTVEIVDFSLISLDKNKKMEDLNQASIAYVQGNPEHEKIIKNVLDEELDSYELLIYENYASLLKAMLLDESFEEAILPKQYSRLAESLGKEEQEKLNRSVVLREFNMEVDKAISNINVLSEPFSVLLIGVNENLSDSLIFVSVNPINLKMTMVSIPRDSYVPIACYPQRNYDKINHSRAISRQCLIDTVEDFLDEEVDFYFETDFYALVKMVDVLGGLELESPISFSGSFPLEEAPNQYKNITVPQGKNLLNGEQVLTFARERYHFPRGDFDRQMNQQYVIKELSAKILSTAKKNPNILLELLEASSNNIDMDLSINREIAPLMGLALKEVNQSQVDALSTFRIDSYQILGTTPMINGISVIRPYQNSLQYIRDKIDENQRLEYSLTHSHGFFFSLKDLVEKEDIYQHAYGPVLGENIIVGESVHFEVPNLLNNSYDSIMEWARNSQVSIRIEKVTEGDSYYDSSYPEGYFIKQYPSAGTYEEKISTLTLYEIKHQELVQAKTVTIPSFKNVSEAIVFANAHGLKLNFEGCEENCNQADLLQVKNAGHKVQQGDSIDLLVQEIKMPDPVEELEQEETEEEKENDQE